MTANTAATANVDALDTAALVALLSTYREADDAAALAVVDAALIARAYA